MGVNPMLYKRMIASLFAAGVAFVALALPQPALAQARHCDRACLVKVMDDYLAAAKAHDPSRLPLDASVKYTENGQRVNIGDGLWRTFSQGPSYRLDVVDEEHGQIALLGILEESGNRNFFSTRIAVEENEKMGRGLEITEIENLVVRNIMGGRGPAQMAMKRDTFKQSVPPAKRLGRAELVAIADSYFTGLDTDESAAHVPFTDTCRRIENGTVTANNPTPSEGMGMAKLGCKAQFDTGFSTIVTDVRERRYPVVDTEKGLVYALVFFDHNGSVARYTDESGESDVAAMMRQPFSFMMAEVFQVRDAKIDQIEAVLMAVPYKMESGW
jgi:hypothetical protein